MKELDEGLERGKTGVHWNSFSQPVGLDCLLVPSGLLDDICLLLSKYAIKRLRN